MIRKVALYLGVTALFVLMVFNGYLAVNHLRRMQKIAVQTQESSEIQTHISDVQRDLTDMETGQRGYLITGDSQYLLPYTNAKSRTEKDFAALRAVLVNREEQRRAEELQLEALANSMQTGMERSIDLGRQGYRHRAFMIVESNVGMDNMNRARGLLSSLSAAENATFLSLDGDRRASFRKGLKEIILGNLCLLLLTAGLFALVRNRGKALERETAQIRQSLAERDLHLEKMTSALSRQARSQTATIAENARLLLQNYGGFLPRQGHEHAEQIKEASAEMERLWQELVGSPESTNVEPPAVEYDSVA
jgi:Predicted periplasmic ligand-binding sensor domain